MNSNCGIWLVCPARTAKIVIPSSAHRPSTRPKRSLIYSLISSGRPVSATYEDKGLCERRSLYSPGAIFGKVNDPAESRGIIVLYHSVQLEPDFWDNSTIKEPRPNGFTPTLTSDFISQP